MRFKNHNVCTIPVRGTDSVLSAITYRVGYFLFIDIFILMYIQSGKMSRLVVRASVLCKVLKAIFVAWSRLCFPDRNAIKHFFERV